MSTTPLAAIRKNVSMLAPVARKLLKSLLLVVLATTLLSPLESLARKKDPPVNTALGALQSIEVKTFQPLFDPTSPVHANPEIAEYIRHQLEQSLILPIASPAQAQLQVNCNNAACLSITAKIYTEKGKPPIWSYKQGTYWFVDVPKNPKTLAKNIVRHLEVDYQAATRNRLPAIH